jgi:hypothetical protein
MNTKKLGIRMWYRSAWIETTGGNSCGRPHSFDCAWVIVMMTKGFGRKWKNMKIPKYFPMID